MLKNFNDILIHIDWEVQNNPCYIFIRIFIRGRYEVIETSSRLHSLWPQNKRLRTPWTTDWMYTRQDRWIQTELVFTLAKNATKPNRFEFTSLQTTRKKNNWKTEETLARTVVTHETERIKGSSPWCLWWWWWWWWW